MGKGGSSKRGKGTGLKSNDWADISMRRGVVALLPPPSGLAEEAAAASADDVAEGRPPKH